MARKLRFWNDRRRKTRKAHRSTSQRGFRKHSLGSVDLGFERLEDRRVLSGGSLDPAFNPGGAIPGVLVSDLGFAEDGRAIAVQNDGKILIVGTVGAPLNRNIGVARYNPDGSLDTTFGVGDGDGVDGLASVDFFGLQDLAADLVLDDTTGSITVVGRVAAPGSSGTGVARLTSAGLLDASFGTGGTTYTTLSILAEGRSIALDSNDNVVVGGFHQAGSGTSTKNFMAIRYTPAGVLDTTFDGDGIAITDFTGNEDEAFDLIVQSDDKIVLVGSARLPSFSQFAMVRYNTDGSLDTTFDTDGRVTTDIVPPFSSNSDRIDQAVLLADGRIVVAGSTSVGSNGNMVVARYNTDGSLDTTTFNTGGSQPGIVQLNFGNASFAEGIALQPDGAYAVVGGTINFGTNEVIRVTRVKDDGTLDTGFGTGGSTTVDLVGGTQIERLRDAAITPSGKIIAGGVVANTDFLLVQLDAGLLAADAGGPYTLDEPGGSVVLNGSHFGGEGTVVYEWDLDGDNIFGEVGAGADNGDEVGTNPTFTVSGADGPDDTFIVTLQLTDDNQTVTDTATITILNVAPTLAISGAANVDEGSVYTLNLSSSDPGDDTITQWTINWGDAIEVVAGNPASVDHAYADGDANYVISATATDEDGTFAAGNTVAVMVDNAAPTADDASFDLVENSPNGTVVGTVTATDPGDDTLTFNIAGGTGAAAFLIDELTGEITVSDSALLDFEFSPILTLEVEVSDGEGGIDTALVTINLLNQASISGVVYVDVNENGQFDANEPGIDGVVVELLDEFGNPVLDGLGDPIAAITSDGGFYLFEDLDPGIYRLFEVQPTGVDDGAEQLGTLGGTIAGNDLMQLTLVRTDAFDYAFAEIGTQLASGDAAGIGFWQNKHGQELITQGGTQLASWLSTNFSNIFGNALDGADGGDVANFYRDQLFKQKAKKGAGPAKVDAQFMAVALATFFTSNNLAGVVATSYGFNVTDTGIGTKIVNIGNNGAAFGVANGTDLTILQLLLATDGLTDQPDAEMGFAAIYDTDGNGVISATEAGLRTLANDVFSSINEAGGI